MEQEYVSAYEAIFINFISLELYQIIEYNKKWFSVKGTYNYSPTFT